MYPLYLQSQQQKKNMTYLEAVQIQKSKVSFFQQFWNVLVR